MPKVTLLAAPENAEKLIAAAAKLCYSSSGIDTLMDNLTEEKTADFVQMLAEIGHESPIEHAAFTFGIEGVSRTFLAQITRHRIASHSVQSQRYVGEYAFEYVTPPEIALDKQANEIFIEAMNAATVSYNKLADLLKQKHIATYMSEGKDEKTASRMAEKKAIEDARFVLPNACDTKMIVTMNARSMMNFFAHRCCNRAQWEIQDVANQMLKLVFEKAPHLFSKAGPPCVNGNCPEGKMSCGKQSQMRQYYVQLKEVKDQ